MSSFAKVTELGNLNLIKRLASAGVGIAFLYEPVVQRELQTGQLREIPLEDCAITHDFSFLWKRGSAFSQEYRHYFSLLQEA